jgi:hypothetical protein
MEYLEKLGFDFGLIPEYGEAIIMDERRRGIFNSALFGDLKT